MGRSFAGIGSRNWSPEQLSKITRLSFNLSAKFDTLNSGNADGSDYAFAVGFPPNRVRLHLPWATYNAQYLNPYAEIVELDAEFLPLAEDVWDKHYTDRPPFRSLKQSVQKLMARNYSIVEASDEVYAAPGVIIGAHNWSDVKSYTGGTKFGILIGKELCKPVHILDMREYVIRKNVFGI